MNKYRVHKLGYWRICLPHDRYRACGGNVLWDDLPTWEEAMAIVNQVGIMTWAAKINEDYRSQRRCF